MFFRNTHVLLAASLLLTSFLSFAEVQTNQAPVPIYDFLKPARYKSLTMSPTGQYVAFVESNNAKACIALNGQVSEEPINECPQKNQRYTSRHTLRIFDISKNVEIKRQQMPYNMYIDWFAWANDTRVLMALRQPTTAGKGRRYRLGASRIMSIDMVSPETTTLFGEERRLASQNRHLSRITNMLRHDPEHIIMPARKEADLDLWKVNVLNGSAEKIATGKDRTFFWYTQRDGTPALRFDCTGFSCGKFNVYRYTAETDSWDKIRTFDIKKLAQGEDVWGFNILTHGEKENQVYVLANDDDENFQVIRLFDYAKNEFVETVYSHPEVDISGALVDISTGMYAGAYYYTDGIHYAYQDSTLQRHYEVLQKYFGDDKNISIFGWTKEKNKALLYVSGPTTTGSYYAYDVEKRQVRNFLSTRPEVDHVLSSHRSSIIDAPMRDGSTIKAYIHSPTAEPSAETPTIIMPHGGPEARDYFDYSSEIQYYLSNGYQVVQMNFRGSSGFGQAFADKGYGEWGGLMQNDVTDTIKYLFTNNMASAKHTCVVGGSYGAYVALMAAAKTPELLSCAVGMAGPYDLKKVVAYDRKRFGATSAVYEYILKTIGDPKNDSDKLDAISPINLTKQINVPILLIHGTEDDVVEFKESRRMHKALTKAGVEVEYIQLKGAGHSLGNLESRMHAIENVVRFLNLHIGKDQGTLSKL